MRKFAILTVIFYVMALAFYNFVLAVNPVSPFTPSDNIQDPDCSPNDSNCYVTVSTTISGLDAADSTNTIDNTNYAQVWDWSTADTEIPLAFSANALTSGNLLSLSSSSTGLTGDLTKIELTGANAGNTGNVLKVGFTGATGTAVPLNVTNAGSGSSFIVNDDGTYSDSTPFLIDASGNVGIGDATPASLLTVGSGDLFQVNSAGAITAVAGYIQGGGTMSLTSANTTQATTSSIFVMNANSLTTGTGFYGASSTLRSGSLMNLVVTGTGALSSTQKVLDVATSGANSTGSQTTYGGYFSNTHTGTASTNIGLYAAASGGTTNYAISAAGSILLNNIVIQNMGSNSISIAGSAPSVTSSFIFGIGAGTSATSADRSNFIGEAAGYQATSSAYSNFLGYNAGFQATSADRSNFIGEYTGYTASAANYSNFIGDAAGNAATSADHSNFIGASVGQSATNADHSNFIGAAAGSFATNAKYSNFIGLTAGNGATNAAYSIFIGYQAGLNDTVSNTSGLGSPILIGSSTSTGGFNRSIAIGWGATNTASNQLVFGGSSTAQQISSVFFGSGVLSAAPVDVIVNGSGASGADLAGASITLAGGKATGNAVGGSIIFQTSDAGVSGSTLQSLTTKATLLASGNFGIGDATPASLFTVGSGDLFQVNSAGAIAAATGYTQGSGTMSLTSANTTQTTTSSIFAMNANSLTTGTGFYGASSTLSSGSLMNLVVTGTAGLTGQKGINVSLSGANGTGAQTTYGGFFSNTHTGTSVNIGLSATASGGSTNYAIESDGALLLDNIVITNMGTRSVSIGAATPAVTDSFLFGSGAGSGATSANNSNFLGIGAGQSASGASDSNFLGQSAGYQATNANQSNFFGASAGQSATNGYQSNMFGILSGYQATNAYLSNFFGYRAGSGATNAANSIFIGTNAGKDDTVDNANTGYNSILIGGETHTGNFSNSIVIGFGGINTATNQLVIGSSYTATSYISNVFFGNGVTASTPSGVVINGSGGSGSDIPGASITVAGGKATGSAAGGSIVFQTSDAGVSGSTLQTLTTKATLLASGNFGLNDTTPDYRFDLEDNVASSVANFFNDGNATSRNGIIIQAGVDDHTAVSTSTLATFNDGDGTTVGSITFGNSLTAYNTTSDERLKENITDTSLSIDDLMDVQIRDFTWKADKDHKISHGFIAQELYEVYPSAVTVPADPSGYYMVDYSKLMPLTIKSIQDLNIQLQDISDFDQPDNSFGEKLREWFGSTTNGIKRLFVKEEICIGETCVNEAQLKTLLQGANVNSSNHGSQSSNDSDIIDNTTDDAGDIQIITGDEIETETTSEEQITPEENTEENTNESEIINNPPPLTGEQTQTNEENTSSN